MTDCELLELAAKAANINVLQKGSGYWVIKSSARKMRGWNPLLDDGDALQLAVKLRMIINPYIKAVFVSRYEHESVEMQRMEDDPYAATRRAIVRAAAEIGRSAEPPSRPPAA